MKKIYVSLFAILFAVSANAFDVVGGLNKVSEEASDAAQKIEAAKAQNESAKEDTKAALDAKKAEAKAALDAKTAEAKAAVEAKRAQDEADTAEKKAAVEDAKNSLNNLKNAFSK